MPKQVNELPVASSVTDSDLTNVKQGAHDRSATIAQINDNIGTAIERADDKPTPVDADILALSDSADSNALKGLTWANVKSVLKSSFEALVFTWALRQVYTIGIKLAAASEGIRFGSGNTATNGDFDMSEATTANAIFRFFRNTNTSGARQFIVYKGDNSATVSLFFDAVNDVLQIAGNLVWHAGNDGSGSGLDADMLDGFDTGVAVGNIPVLEDVGGNPGLPAVDGSQLTNLPVDPDEKVKTTSDDSTAGYLEDKVLNGDGILVEVENNAGVKNLKVSLNQQAEARLQLLAVASSDGQTVILFNDPIVDDFTSAYNGVLKNHLIFRNGQLLVNTAFNSIISPETGDYSVTDEATGEITLETGSEASEGDIFTYIDIRRLIPVPA